MNLVRGKLFGFLAQHSPSDRKQLIKDYYNKDHLVRKFGENHQNVSKPQQKRQRYQIDDSAD